MKNLFVWEIRKNVKKKAVIGIGIAMLVLLVLFAITYNAVADIFQEIQSGGLDGTLKPEEAVFSKEELIGYIDMYEEQLKELDELEKKGENVYSARFELKSQILSLKYALEHGYYDKPVKIEGFNTYGLIGAEGFTTIYVSVVAMIVLVYGIILGASAYCNEYKSGTIKLVMTKPVTKNSVTAAKLLSMYAVLAVMYFVPALVGFAYGGIAFGSLCSTKIIYTFNATAATVTSLGALTFGTIMNNFINILVMATLSFGLATVTRSSAAGVVPSIVIVFGVGNFLKQTGISAFLLSTSLDFSVYFGGTDVPKNGNFFISLAVVLFWWIASIVASFVVTNKRDVY